MNVVAITGRLTRDPELRSLASGTSVCEISIALNSREKRGDDWGERVDYIDVTVWGKQGENVAHYLSKGRHVAVKGRLRQDRWETDGGDKRSKVKVIADMVEFLGGRDDDGQAPASDIPADTSGMAATSSPASGVQDDIPF